MKKGLSQLIVLILDKNIRKEVDSVCLGFGYQPPMPENVNKFKRKKK
ncbi:MAG: cyclic lactone autoinducer peptide [Lachnospiraceae bacterium]|nr:cyclic lactone autoinducer peptide [Lachnospiraceae bacterium]